MNLTEERLDIFRRQDILQSLSQITRGLEKECLRVDQDGRIAKTPHPRALGSSLKHPMITTDYSEALLEFITPPLQDAHLMFKTLTDLHQFTYQHLKDEFLWPGSMPCRLSDDKDIPIAQYGSSNLGRLKYIYRLGLGYRYGRRMQMIAGIHYNFSFSSTFWKCYAAKQKVQGELRDFISEQYLGLIRNAFRLSWLLPFFFGASPAICSNFLAQSDPSFQTLQGHTHYLPYATSLRLSDLGYHNKIKPIVNVSYDSFPEFLETMHAAVHTPDPAFMAIGVQNKGEYLQLSASSLQVEDEHYAMFRPKRIAATEERMLAALKREGIEYIEVRALDINPFLPLGVDLETVYFLDIFLMLCLLMDSPRLSTVEQERIQTNISQVVKKGRDPSLTLRDEKNKQRLLVDWAGDILLQMQTIAQIIDNFNSKPVYTQIIQNAQDKLHNPSKLPSAQLLSLLLKNKQSFFDLMMAKARDTKTFFAKLPWSEVQSSSYSAVAEESLRAANAIEDRLPFDEFLKNFLSA